MACGFLYLVAIIDWASRAVLAWRLSNTNDASFCAAAAGGDASLRKAADRNFFPHTPPSTTPSTSNAISSHLRPNAARTSRCRDDHVADCSRSSLTIHEALTLPRRTGNVTKALDAVEAKASNLASRPKP